MDTGCRDSRKQEQVSRLSNGPYGTSHGLLLGLIEDTKWTC